MTTDMFRKCVKCGATPVEDGVVSFHRFPKPGKTNIERARAWARYCWPEKDWTTVHSLMQLFKNNKVLCKRHFEDYCYTDNSKTQLGRFSVPGSRNDATQFTIAPGIQTLVIQPNAALMVQDVSKQCVMYKHEPLPNETEHKSTDCQPCTSAGTRNSPIIMERGQTSKSQKNKEIAILKSIGVTKLNELTAREKKLYNICIRSLKEISRLREILKIIPAKKNTENTDRVENCDAKNVKS